MTPVRKQNVPPKPVRNTSYCHNPRKESALTENKAVHLCPEDGGNRFL